ncbi:MAG: hypothetical protein Kow0099_30600 [Candidatus Abyssubacteria bacterium]
MDMSDLSLRDGIFDLIWLEGALNLMGFSGGVLRLMVFVTDLCSVTFCCRRGDSWWSASCAGFGPIRLPNVGGSFLQRIRPRYMADQEKLDFIRSIQEEIDIYRKYSSYYGYMFYLMESR